MTLKLAWPYQNTNKISILLLILKTVKKFDKDIQGTDARNGVMKQTKSELDEDNLTAIVLKNLQTKINLKRFKKLINNNNQSYLQQWIQVGSLKN